MLRGHDQRAHGPERKRTAIAEAAPQSTSGGWGPLMGGMSSERPSHRCLADAFEVAACAATLPLVRFLWLDFDSYQPPMGAGMFLCFWGPPAFLLWLVWVTAAARVARDLWPSAGWQRCVRRALAVSAVGATAAALPLWAEWAASGEGIYAGVGAVALVPAGYLVWAWASWRIPQ